MAFQNQLKKLMNEKNMKAVDLARATGLSEAAISDYLKGKKEPRGRQSIAIATALCVSLDTLWETNFQQKSFPIRLKEARIAIGYTPQQVANLMGITTSIYCEYETGKQQPDIKKIKQLANILNISDDILLRTSFEVSTHSAKQKEFFDIFNGLSPALQDHLIKMAKDLLETQSKIQSSKENN